MSCKVIVLALCLFGVTFSFPRNDFEADVRYLQLEVDGEQYDLTLKQRVREIIYETTPVWTVKSSEEGYEYTKIETENRQINGIFYNDEQYMASLLASYNEEGTQIYYDGVVGVGSNVHVVRQYPEKWWANPEAKDEDNSEAKSSENEDKKESEEVSEQNSKLRSSYVKGKDVGALEKPLSVLHPKILAVVDYELFQQMGENVQETIKYVATFFDAVDLRYSQLVSTKVEILVTGIVIVADGQTGLVQKAREYFSEQFIEDTEMTNYDTAFVMTSNAGVMQGESHLGSICNRQYSTAFVQDDAVFAGLISATHELGHLLNLPHDGYDEAESCEVVSEENSTFMAPSVSGAKVVKWSQCSRNILQAFTKSKAAECLEGTYRYE